MNWASGRISRGRSTDPRQAFEVIRLAPRATGQWYYAIRLRTRYGSQYVTTAARQMAEKKV